MWKIMKIEGLHTCTVARMSQDRRKLDEKTICNCIIPLVNDSPTIPISTLIADMQARFKYKVSYKKAWWVKQMAMQQLYSDFDASYNELQMWVAAMREHVPRTFLNCLNSFFTVCLKNHFLQAETPHYLETIKHISEFSHEYRATSIISCEAWNPYSNMIMDYSTCSSTS
ncbi:hypothetical protein GOBAR_DD15920 [Gossypium barbadense]|nr:hypothetical protein GOBAR_DD15920 [Gossypium barbadense]